MTSFLPLPSSSSIPPSPSSPILSSRNSQVKTKIDTEALAMLIKQLKRSPQSPSRLTLPPIMGIINEEDENQLEDEEEEGGGETSVIVEEVETSPNTDSSNGGLFDIPEEDEEEDGDEIEDQQLQGDQSQILISPMKKLWVIDEESEHSDMEEDPSESLFDTEENYGDENVPPIYHANEEDTLPIDPFSPPPPSPCMTNIPSPTLPDSPSIPSSSTYFDLDLECYVQEEDDEAQKGFQEGALVSDYTPFVSVLSSEQFTDAPVPLQEQSTISVTDTSTIPQQKRRRRTLGELEQYRKFAMNKAAWKSFQEAEALEERRRIREQEEREGIWMRYRSTSSRSRSRERTNHRPDLITRAQSFPPVTKSSELYSVTSTPDYSRGHSYDTTDRIMERDDHFSSNWYTDDDDEENGQIQHVEYASLPQPTHINVPVSQEEYEQDEEEDDEEGVFSPTSDQINTPELSDQSRRFFPSASEIFGSTSMSRYPSNDSSNSSNDSWDNNVGEEPTFPSISSGPSIPHGLGLGLSGMNTTAGHNSKNARMSFDQMIRYEEGREVLEEDEISLVELPIKVIFPERTFEEFKAAGREYTRKYKEDRGRQDSDMAFGSNQDDTQIYRYQERSNLDERSNYREDLDGFPIPERGRSRSRMGCNIDKCSGSTETYLSYPSIAPDSTHNSQSSSAAYFGEQEYNAVSGHNDNEVNRFRSISPESIYSDEGQWQKNNVNTTISPERSVSDNNEDYQENICIDHRRRHSAPGKLPSHQSIYTAEDDLEQVKGIGNGEGYELDSPEREVENGRPRSKSDPDIHTTNTSRDISI